MLRPSVRLRARSNRAGRSLQVETLESRALPSAVLANGLLDIVGSKLNNTIAVTFDGSTQHVEVQIDGQNPDPLNPTGYDIANVDRIRIRGLGGNDTISIDNAISLPTTILGAAGADTLTGGAGSDSLNGGPGNDSITGGAGADSLIGGLGNDTIAGGDDDDAITGLAGNDLVSGDDGDDAIDGGTGNDTVQGGDGNDALAGGAGLDTVDGGDGEDLLVGGAGDDSLSGDDGSDFLSGDAGNDLLDGGDGDDVLRTGKGSDILTGGTGDDLFGPIVLSGARTDFTAGADIDASAAVTTGNFTDPGLEGTRTDLLSGAPDVNDRHHQTGVIDYSAYTNPPTYGPHHPFRPGKTPRPTGVYTTPQRDEDLVHNLEHGHVWLSYNPSMIDPLDLVKLEFVVSTYGPGHGLILTPRPANDVPIALASWAHLETMSSFDLDEVLDFIVANRGHAPEGFITP